MPAPDGTEPDLAPAALQRERFGERDVGGCGFTLAVASRYCCCTNSCSRSFSLGRRSGSRLDLLRELRDLRREWRPMNMS